MNEVGGTLASLVVFIIAGILSGVVYDIFKIIKTATKNYLLVTIISDIFFCLISTAVFIYCIFKYEFGSFALFEIVVYVIGNIFEQIFIKNLFAKPIKCVYNKIKLRKIKQKEE